MKQLKTLLLTLFLSVLLDQIIKIVVSYNMGINDTISIINNFFSITYVTNIGAAWSILSGGRILLILLAILAINLIYFMFIYKKEIDKKNQIFYGLLLGGIIGNLIDRIVFGYVIDYLDFNIFGYNFPVFNLADILITLSVIFIVIFSKVKNENSSR